MTDHEVLISKLCAQAEGERACGNHEAAAAFEARAEKLRKKYDLAPPVVKPAVEPSKSPVMQPQKQRNYFSDFPGVDTNQHPLTAAQLQSLRDAAAVVGRPLSQHDADRALGRKSEDAPKGESKCDRYFEV
jgi:hypothetical protein